MEQLTEREKEFLQKLRDFAAPTDHPLVGCIVASHGGGTIRSAAAPPADATDDEVIAHFKTFVKPRDPDSDAAKKAYASLLSQFRATNEESSVIAVRYTTENSGTHLTLLVLYKDN